MSGKQVLNLEAEIHGITLEEAQARFSLKTSEDILLRVFRASYRGKVVLLHG